jgi:hypothetical protein
MDSVQPDDTLRGRHGECHRVRMKMQERIRRARRRVRLPPAGLAELASVQRIDAGIFRCIEGLAASGCPPLQMSSACSIAAGGMACGTHVDPVIRQDSNQSAGGRFTHERQWL